MSEHETKRSTADVLYGASHEVANALTQRDNQSRPASERDVADALFGSVESLVSSYGPALADAADRLSDRTGMSQADRDAHVTEMASAFDDARIPPREAAALHSLIVQHVGKPADSATVDAWTMRSRQLLRDRYGIDEGQRRMAIVGKFIENRPALAKLLKETGITSHPDVIMALAESPDAIRLTPRKKA